MTNSSGITVYWSQGGSNGSIADTGTLNCVQGASNLKWNFSEAAAGTVRITLTVTGGGGGSPGAKSQGEGPGKP